MESNCKCEVALYVMRSRMIDSNLPCARTGWVEASHRYKQHNLNEQGKTGQNTTSMKTAFLKRYAVPNAHSPACINANQEWHVRCFITDGASPAPPPCPGLHNHPFWWFSCWHDLIMLSAWVVATGWRSFSLIHPLFVLTRVVVKAL